MNYEVLARRLRPNKFDKVFAHKPVLDALRAALKQKSVGHAYLFTGTRGIGKTTIARLLAKALRCENLDINSNPCLSCRACIDFDSGSSIDVLEIDGASNNSVENAREIISNVHYLPSFGQFKIVIIDEVHMLTVSAFNALLKTLEEPPSHVKFIFATTEPEKLLGTVISRCQRFDLRPATHHELVDYLKQISKDEKINFSSNECIEQIAELSRGSYRDSLSILERLHLHVQNNLITEDALVTALGVPRNSAIKEILLSIILGDSKRFLDTYKKLLKENFQAKTFLNILTNNIYNCINSIDDLEAYFEGLSKDLDAFEDISFAEILWIYETIIKDADWILKSFEPERSIELVLLKVLKRREILLDKKSIKKSANDLERSVAKNPALDLKKKEAEKTALSNRRWGEFLDYLKGPQPSLVAHLEEGNLIRPLNLDIQNSMSIAYGFPVEASIFFEHLKSESLLEKLKISASEFFNIEKGNLTISIEICNDSNFCSIAKMSELDRKKDLDIRKNKFLNDPSVKNLEKIFNAKIENVQKLNGDKV